MGHGEVFQGKVNRAWWYKGLEGSNGTERAKLRQKREE